MYLWKDSFYKGTFELFHILVFPDNKNWIEKNVFHEIEKLHGLVRQHDYSDVI